VKHARSAVKPLARTSIVITDDDDFAVKVRGLSAFRIAVFFIAIAAMSYPQNAVSASVGLGIALSPETAHLIRDWRRVHSLPQAPETNEGTHPLGDRAAISKALRFIGFYGVARENLHIATSHMNSYWRVTIHLESTPDSADYVIDVGDATANSPTAAALVHK
jgi:hypothetical protein